NLRERDAQPNVVAPFRGTSSGGSMINNAASNISMTNIPTDLLRTLVCVVDLRSFTKSAHALGVTQPAISAQIKRLQMLLGRELLDKRAPGVRLTAAGEQIVGHARKLLQINDQIMHLAGPRPAGLTIRVGISSDFASAQLPWILAGFRTRWPDGCFVLRSAA